MSRIHDALLRAQQERALTAGEPAGPPPAAVALEPETLPMLVHSADLAPQALPGAATPGELSYKLLQQRCALQQWNFAAGRNLAAADGVSDGLEELRTLRTRLYQLRGNMAQLKVVLIASSLPGEGKTFLSCMLSQIITRQRGRHALLIDGDLRIPRLHKEFGAPAAPGLAEYLKGEADEIAVIQRGPVEGLMLVPGGSQLPNPAELLAGNGLRRLIDRVAHCFDWVFIDSPAAIPIADASILAGVCDGVLMVVKAASTPFDLAQKARQEFARSRMLGVVLNGVAKRANYTSYYYRSYATGS